MTNSASAVHLDTRFNSFLFAAIGESETGACITVLSALARLNVDPWKKAAELSRLPGDVASQKLASLMATLPELHPENLKPRMIDRLIALLPTGRAMPDFTQSFGFGVVTKAQTLIIYVTLMVVIVGATYVWKITGYKIRPRVSERLRPARSNRRCLVRSPSIEIKDTRETRRVTLAALPILEMAECRHYRGRAYGRSRLREWVFGGVTKDLLPRRPGPYRNSTSAQT